MSSNYSLLGLYTLNYEQLFRDSKPLTGHNGSMNLIEKYQKRFAAFLLGAVFMLAQGNRPQRAAPALNSYHDPQAPDGLRLVCLITQMRRRR